MGRCNGIIPAEHLETEETHHSHAGWSPRRWELLQCAPHPLPQMQIKEMTEGVTIPPLSFSGRWKVWHFPSKVQRNLSSSPGACKEGRLAFPAQGLATILATHVPTEPRKRAHWLRGWGLPRGHKDHLLSAQAPRL